jgi:monoterpene epsilon-lactone hydrolase
MPSLRSRLLKRQIHRMNFLFRSAGRLDRVRRRTDAAARLLPVPRGASIRPAECGGVPGEWLIPRGSPDGRALLYIHGGGFLFCSLATHRGLTARLARAAGVRAFSVDYRLAPEHPFPAALDDCLQAYRGMRAGGMDAAGIVVAGDSAGGNLALAMLLALRRAGEEPPAAAVGISPLTDMTFSGGSMRSKSGIDPVFHGGAGGTVSVDILDVYVGSADPRDELLSPLFADWRGMPPVLLHVGEDEGAAR